MTTPARGSADAGLIGLAVMVLTLAGLAIIGGIGAIITAFQVRGKDVSAPAPATV